MPAIGILISFLWMGDVVSKFHMAIKGTIINSNQFGNASVMKKVRNKNHSFLHFEKLRQRICGHMTLGKFSYLSRAKKRSQIKSGFCLVTPQLLCQQSLSVNKITFLSCGRISLNLSLNNLWNIDQLVLWNISDFSLWN